MTFMPLAHFTLIHRRVTASTAAAAALTAALFVLDPRGTERTGLHFQVYEGTTFDGAPLIETVSSELTLDFLEQDPELPRRFFSARWQGYWYVPKAREINLSGAGDDRLDVWLDGNLVIRRTPPAAMHTEVRTLFLDAGPHDLRVEYAQHGGAYAMRLGWEPPGYRSRALAAHRLFPERPSPWDVRLAWLVAWLAWVVPLFWAVPLAVAAPTLARKSKAILARVGPESSFAGTWELGFRAVLGLAIIAIVVRAVIARLPGWNPASLWYDDLVYAAIIRTQDFWSMVTAPLHVGPGLLVIWRGFYAIFPDPEWSLQLLPFACAVAAIPLMALVVRTLTNDNALAVLAAGVTALNQLLAHYTVFVHQYTVEFVTTALFLLVAARISSDIAHIDPRRFGRVALCGGLATFFSVTSVFASFPIINLCAAYAIRNRTPDRGRTTAILWRAAAYNAAVFAAYLLLRNRSNPYARALFADGFMPLDSIGEALGFLAENGRHLLETSLPGWGTGWHLRPGTVSWPLPFLALGIGWLLAYRPTRFFGLVVLGFYATRVVASALWIYPLGIERTDVFAFPVAICLFAAGIHAATAAFPRPGVVRLTAAAAVVAFAVARPVDVWYFDVADRPLVDRLASAVRPDDGIVLSESGIFLTAFYGPWAVASKPADNASYGTAVTLVRDRVLHLPRSATQGRRVARFLRGSPADRVWYVAHNTQGWEDDVVAAIESGGYAVHEVQKTRSGRLYLGRHQGGAGRK